MARGRRTPHHKTRLEEERLTPTYRRRLRTCWATLLAWFVSRRLDYLALVRDPERLDELMVHYVFLRRK